ncbi:hypothetical protein RF11_15753 [Thelohanellus kitauei]|uniref:Reverse transcriptase/retrotransposon-derived protein RNase H-like domain-containing protein n=1 Tax=Thelohanellus kitauei TaxID=669202 RepID=A0A0C2JRJ2_THEKT|nr:hypothetical protein RF11_15753 [Thelohanellus kitauei]
MHFQRQDDADLSMVIEADPSARGVDAVLLHKFQNGCEQTIAYASNKVNTRKYYSIIVKEALAIGRSQAVEIFICFEESSASTRISRGIINEIADALSCLLNPTAQDELKRNHAESSLEVILSNMYLRRRYIYRTLLTDHVKVYIYITLGPIDDKSWLVLVDAFSKWVDNAIVNHPDTE